MKKLDKNLSLYLGSTNMSANEEQLTLDDREAGADAMAVERLREEQLRAFARISAIKLQMEALTLQPEGTKRMELLQCEVRPIFTVECQLSHELIKNVPRYEMFHIMQFESEKFNGLTQCTRFGQEAQRDVKLSLDNSAGDVAVAADGQTKLNFGRIHFTVWWREPGTCLNEMLGMGELMLEELYNASLLEQCKQCTINRRGVHLASLYFKISLKQENPMPAGAAAVVANPPQLFDSADIAAVKANNINNNAQDQSEDGAAGIDTIAPVESKICSGEYIQTFLYLKDTKVQ